MGFLRLTKIKAVSMVLAGLAVAVAVLAIVSLNKPALGTVTQIAPAEEKIPEKKTITGKNISFQYPARYSESSNQNQSASLEYWILVTRIGQGTGPTGQVSVIITNLPEGGVKEDSSYKNVHAFTDKYKLSDATYNNEPVILAKRVDPTYERVALWSHKKLLLTATMSSSADSEQLNNEFDELLRSVVWQP